MLWNAVRTLDGMMCILQLFESLSFFLLCNNLQSLPSKTSCTSKEQPNEGSWVACSCWMLLVLIFVC